MIKQFKCFALHSLMSTAVLMAVLLAGLSTDAKGNSVFLTSENADVAEPNDQVVGEFQDNLNKGVKAFTEQKYDEAAQFFEMALELDPDFEVARMYMATAYTAQFVPGSTDPTSDEMANKAIETFKDVVDRAKDPSKPNVHAMLSIASLYYQLRKNAESREWCENIFEIDPLNAEAYYRIAIIDFEDVIEKTGVQGEKVDYMKPAEKAKALRDIEEGLTSLAKALEIRPNYFNAMEYQNLLLREKAKFEKDETAKAELIRQADLLSQRALDLRRKGQE